MKDLRGMRFGKLVCLEPTEMRSEDRNVVWRCRCDCGNECLAASSKLLRGEKKSCGCIQQPQQIEPGQRFGKLVVTGYAGVRNRRSCWNCRCDCGSECIVSGTELLLGRRKSCGCMRRTREIEPGQRFGMLTVTGYAGVHDHRRSWNCRCDCGRECIASGRDLADGKRKSCGCLRPAPRGDLTGQRFGQLTVLALAEKKGRKVLWRCRCDCGNETVVWQSNLLSGHTKSCGCLQRESPRINQKLVDGTSVTQIEKRRHTPIQSNTSGYTGVYMNNRTGLWAAQLTFKGKTYYLGSYSDIQDAVRARRRAEEVYDDFLAWYYAQNERVSAP